MSLVNTWQTFFQIHEKYEAFCNETATNVYETDEHILMLGGIPLRSFESFIDKVYLKSSLKIRSSKESLKIVQHV